MLWRDDHRESSIDLVFLHRGGNLFVFPLTEPAGSPEASQPRFQVMKGYTFVQESRGSGGPLGRLGSLWAMIGELLQLYRQIGARSLMRYIQTKSVPRCLYVDAIEIMDPDNGERKILRSPYGIPLCTSYTADRQDLWGCVETQLESQPVAQTYLVDDLLRRSRIARRSERRRRQEKASGALRKTMGHKQQPRWLVAGAGTYCTSILIPSIQNAGGRVVGICSQSEINARIVAETFDILHVFPDIEAMLDSRVGEQVLIATPHYLHPLQLRMALQRGYRVYCEKPVAIDETGLELLKPLASSDACMVGFNRRFAPAVTQLLQDEALRQCHGPKMITYIVNFGSQYNRTMSDPAIGGGKLHGACCHYLDLIEYVAQSRIMSFQVSGLRTLHGDGDRDNFTCVCALEDGSVGALVFSSLGRRDFDVKERLIVTGDGLNVRIDDFTSVLINGRRERIFWDYLGAKAAIVHFQRTLPLDASRATPMLADGIHITNLTLAMERALLNSIGEPEPLHATID